MVGTQWFTLAVGGLDVKVVSEDCDSLGEGRGCLDHTGCLVMGDFGLVSFLCGEVDLSRWLTVEVKQGETDSSKKLCLPILPSSSGP